MTDKPDAATKNDLLESKVSDAIENNTLDDYVYNLIEKFNNQSESIQFIGEFIG